METGDFKSKVFRKLPQEELDKIMSDFIEVELIQPFQIIRETLSRMGILVGSGLYQTAHILHKKNRYYIVHFKQLFELDGRASSLTDEDKLRLYKIINILIAWNLIKIIKKEDFVKITETKNTYVGMHIAKVEDIRSGKILLKKKYNL